MSPSKPLSHSQVITRSGLLTALAILIPIIMPLKVVIGPASYTLASHLPIFLAIFQTPFIAIVVAGGAALGFLLAGFPIPIVARALSHLLFASIGAYYIQKHGHTFLQKPQARIFFSFWLNLIHGLAEMLVIYVLIQVGMTAATGAMWSFLVIFIGLGTVIHGMVDFELAFQLSQALKKA